VQNKYYFFVEKSATQQDILLRADAAETESFFKEMNCSKN